MGHRLQPDMVNISSDSMHVKWNTCAHDSSAVGLLDSMSAMLCCRGNIFMVPRHMAHEFACKLLACCVNRERGFTQWHACTHTRTHVHTHLLHNLLPIFFSKVRQLLQFKLPTQCTSRHYHTSPRVGKPMQLPILVGNIRSTPGNISFLKWHSITSHVSMAILLKLIVFMHYTGILYHYHADTWRISILF